MSNVEHLKVGGSVNLWDVAKSTSIEEVREGLKGLGLEQFTPEKRTPMGCLSAALKKVYLPREKGERIVVRPIPKGFAVVAEKPQDAAVGGDWQETLATATIDDSGLISLSPFDVDKLCAIKDGMAGAARWLTAGSVTAALVKIIDHFGGFPLRKHGGVYWLLDAVLPRWQAVARVFETASAQADGEGEPAAPTAIGILRVVADEQMVVTVGRALTQEIQAELEAIEAELHGVEELKPQACENRIRKCGKLSEKVNRYAEAFGVPMIALTEAVNRTATALALSQLESAAASNPTPPFAFMAAV